MVENEEQVEEVVEVEPAPMPEPEPVLETPCAWCHGTGEVVDVMTKETSACTECGL